MSVPYTYRVVPYMIWSFSILQPFFKTMSKVIDYYKRYLKQLLVICIILLGLTISVILQTIIIPFWGVIMLHLLISIMLFQFILRATVFPGSLYIWKVQLEKSFWNQLSDKLLNNVDKLICMLTILKKNSINGHTDYSFSSPENQINHEILIHLLTGSQAIIVLYSLSHHLQYQLAYKWSPTELNSDNVSPTYYCHKCHWLLKCHLQIKQLLCCLPACLCIRHTYRSQKKDIKTKFNSIRRKIVTILNELECCWIGVPKEFGNPSFNKKTIITDILSNECFHDHFKYYLQDDIQQLILTHTSNICENQQLNKHITVSSMISPNEQEIIPWRFSDFLIELYLRSHHTNGITRSNFFSKQIHILYQLKSTLLFHDKVTSHDFNGINLQHELNSIPISQMRHHLKDIQQMIRCVEKDTSYFLPYCISNFKRFIPEYPLGSLNYLRAELAIKYYGIQFWFYTRDHLKLDGMFLPSKQYQSKTAYNAIRKRFYLSYCHHPLYPYKLFSSKHHVLHDVDDHHTQEHYPQDWDYGPVIIFFNPNAAYYESSSYDNDWIDFYLSRNVNLIIYNYRGFGRSEGLPNPSTLISDAEDLTDMLLRPYLCISDHIPLSKYHGTSSGIMSQTIQNSNLYKTSGIGIETLGVHGRSIGGIPAIHLAWKYKHRVKWLCADRTFNSLNTVATYLIGSWSSLALQLGSCMADNVQKYLDISTAYKLMCWAPDDGIIHDLASLKSGIISEIVHTTTAINHKTTSQTFFNRVKHFRLQFIQYVNYCLKMSLPYYSTLHTIENDSVEINESIKDTDIQIISQDVSLPHSETMKSFPFMFFDDTALQTILYELDLFKALMTILNNDVDPNSNKEDQLLRIIRHALILSYPEYKTVDITSFQLREIFHYNLTDLRMVGDLLFNKFESCGHVTLDCGVYKNFPYETINRKQMMTQFISSLLLWGCSRSCHDATLINSQLLSSKKNDSSPIIYSNSLTQCLIQSGLSLNQAQQLLTPQKEHDLITHNNSLLSTRLDLEYANYLRLTGCTWFCHILNVFTHHTHNLTNKMNYHEMDPSSTINTSPIKLNSHLLTISEWESFSGITEQQTSSKDLSSLEPSNKNSPTNNNVEESTHPICHQHAIQISEFNTRTIICENESHQPNQNIHKCLRHIILQSINTIHLFLDTIKLHLKNSVKITNNNLPQSYQNQLESSNINLTRNSFNFNTHVIQTPINIEQIGFLVPIKSGHNGGLQENEIETIHFHLKFSVNSLGHVCMCTIISSCLSIHQVAFVVAIKYNVPESIESMGTLQLQFEPFTFDAYTLIFQWRTGELTQHITIKNLKEETLSVLDMKTPCYIASCCPKIIQYVLCEKTTLFISVAVVATLDTNETNNPRHEKMIETDSKIIYLFILYMNAAPLYVTTPTKTKTFVSLLTISWHHLPIPSLFTTAFLTHIPSYIWDPCSPCYLLSVCRPVHYCCKTDTEDNYTSLRFTHFYWSLTPHISRLENTLKVLWYLQPIDILISSNPTDNLCLLPDNTFMNNPTLRKECFQIQFDSSMNDIVFDPTLPFETVINDHVLLGHSIKEYHSTPDPQADQAKNQHISWFIAPVIKHHSLQFCTASHSETQDSPPLLIFRYNYTEATPSPRKQDHSKILYEITDDIDNPIFKQGTWEIYQVLLKRRNIIKHSVTLQPECYNYHILIKKICDFPINFKLNFLFLFNSQLIPMTHLDETHRQQISWEWFNTLQLLYQSYKLNHQNDFSMLTDDVYTTYQTWYLIHTEPNQLTVIPFNTVYTYRFTPHHLNTLKQIHSCQTHSFLMTPINVSYTLLPYQSFLLPELTSHRQYPYLIKGMFSFRLFSSMQHDVGRQTQLYHTHIIHTDTSPDPFNHLLESLPKPIFICKTLYPTCAMYQVVFPQLASCHTDDEIIVTLSTTMYQSLIDNKHVHNPLFGYISLVFLWILGRIQDGRLLYKGHAFHDLLNVASYHIIIEHMNFSRSLTLPKTHYWYFIPSKQIYDVLQHTHNFSDPVTTISSYIIIILFKNIQILCNTPLIDSLQTPWIVWIHELCQWLHILLTDLNRGSFPPQILMTDITQQTFHHSKMTSWVFFKQFNDILGHIDYLLTVLLYPLDELCVHNQLTTLSGEDILLRSTIVYNVLLSLELITIDKHEWDRQYSCTYNKAYRSPFYSWLSLWYTHIYLFHKEVTDLTLHPIYLTPFQKMISYKCHDTLLPVSFIKQVYPFSDWLIKHVYTLTYDLFPTQYQNIYTTQLNSITKQLFTNQSPVQSLLIWNVFTSIWTTIIKQHISNEDCDIQTHSPMSYMEYPVVIKNNYDHIMGIISPFFQTVVPKIIIIEHLVRGLLLLIKHTSHRLNPFQFSRHQSCQHISVNILHQKNTIHWMYLYRIIQCFNHLEVIISSYNVLHRIPDPLILRLYISFVSCLQSNIYHLFLLLYYYSLFIPSYSITLSSLIVWLEFIQSMLCYMLIQMDLSHRTSLPSEHQSLSYHTVTDLLLKCVKKNKLTQCVFGDVDSYFFKWMTSKTSHKRRQCFERLLQSQSILLSHPCPFLLLNNYRSRYVGMSLYGITRPQDTTTSLHPPSSRSHSIVNHHTNAHLFCNPEILRLAAELRRRLEQEGINHQESLSLERQDRLMNEVPISSHSSLHLKNDDIPLESSHVSVSSENDLTILETIYQRLLMLHMNDDSFSSEHTSQQQSRLHQHPGHSSLRDNLIDHRQRQLNDDEKNYYQKQKHHESQMIDFGVKINLITTLVQNYGHIYLTLSLYPCIHLNTYKELYDQSNVLHQTTSHLSSLCSPLLDFLRLMIYCIISDSICWERHIVNFDDLMQSSITHTPSCWKQPDVHLTRVLTHPHSHLIEDTDDRRTMESYSIKKKGRFIFCQSESSYDVPHNSVDISHYHTTYLFHQTIKDMITDICSHTSLCIVPLIVEVEDNKKKLDSLHETHPMTPASSHLNHNISNVYYPDLGIVSSVCNQSIHSVITPHSVVPVCDHSESICRNTSCSFNYHTDHLDDIIINDLSDDSDEDNDSMTYDGISDEQEHEDTLDNQFIEPFLLHSVNYLTGNHIGEYSRQKSTIKVKPYDQFTDDSIRCLGFQCGIQIGLAVNNTTDHAPNEHLIHLTDTLTHDTSLKEYYSFITFFHHYVSTYTQMDPKDHINYILSMIDAIQTYDAISTQAIDWFNEQLHFSSASSNETQDSHPFKTNTHYCLHIDEHNNTMQDTVFEDADHKGDFISGLLGGFLLGIGLIGEYKTLTLGDLFTIILIILNIGVMTSENDQTYMISEQHNQHSPESSLQTMSIQTQLLFRYHTTHSRDVSSKLHTHQQQHILRVQHFQKSCQLLRQQHIDMTHDSNDPIDHHTHPPVPSFTHPTFSLRSKRFPFACLILGLCVSQMEYEQKSKAIVQLFMKESIGFTDMTFMDTLFDQQHTSSIDITHLKELHEKKMFITRLCYLCIPSAIGRTFGTTIHSYGHHHKKMMHHDTYVSVYDHTPLYSPIIPEHPYSVPERSTLRCAWRYGLPQMQTFLDSYKWDTTKDRWSKNKKEQLYDDHEMIVTQVFDPERRYWESIIAAIDTLEITIDIEIGAILGLGLLYFGSSERLPVEVLLDNIRLLLRGYHPVESLLHSTIDTTILPCSSSHIHTVTEATHNLNNVPVPSWIISSHSYQQSLNGLHHTMVAPPQSSILLFCSLTALGMVCFSGLSDSNSHQMSCHLPLIKDDIGTNFTDTNCDSHPAQIYQSFDLKQINEWKPGLNDLHIIQFLLTLLDDITITDRTTDIKESIGHSIVSNQEHQSSCIDEDYSFIPLPSLTINDSDFLNQFKPLPYNTSSSLIHDENANIHKLLQDDDINVFLPASLQHLCTLFFMTQPLSDMLKQDHLLFETFPILSTHSIRISLYPEIHQDDWNIILERESYPTTIIQEQDREDNDCNIRRQRMSLPVHSIIPMTHNKKISNENDRHDISDPKRQRLTRQTLRKRNHLNGWSNVPSVNGLTCRVREEENHTQTFVSNHPQLMLYSNDTCINSENTSCYHRFHEKQMFSRFHDTLLPGIYLALGLCLFNTSDKTVLNSVHFLSTTFGISQFYKIMSRGMITWKSIGQQQTHSIIDALSCYLLTEIPTPSFIIQQIILNTHIIQSQLTIQLQQILVQIADERTLAYAGVILVIGLKYCGTLNTDIKLWILYHFNSIICHSPHFSAMFRQDVSRFMFEHCRHMTFIETELTNTCSEYITLPIISFFSVVCCMALSLIMAGTGDIYICHLIDLLISQETQVIASCHTHSPFKGQQHSCCFNQTFPTSYQSNEIINPTAVLNGINQDIHHDFTLSNACIHPDTPPSSIDQSTKDSTSIKSHHLYTFKYHYIQRIRTIRYLKTALGFLTLGGGYFSIIPNDPMAMTLLLISMNPSLWLTSPINANDTQQDMLHLHDLSMLFSNQHQKDKEEISQSILQRTFHLMSHDYWSPIIASLGIASTSRRSFLSFHNYVQSPTTSLHTADILIQQTIICDPLFNTIQTTTSMSENVPSLSIQSNTLRLFCHITLHQQTNDYWDWFAELIQAQQINDLLLRPLSNLTELNVYIVIPHQPPRLLIHLHPDHIQYFKTFEYYRMRNMTEEIVLRIIQQRILYSV